MQGKESAYWGRFLKSGQIVDYLLYSAARGTQEGDNKPLRRIVDSSIYKKFY